MNEIKYDKLLISISMLVVMIVVAFLYIEPVYSQKMASYVFGLFTDLFGSFTLLFTFFSVVILVYLSASKFGKIKLGDSKPEYTTFKWVAMMMSCGLGSATGYWAFVEWGYYISTPGLGIEKASQLAYEMSLPYVMFHWGFSPWSLYAFMAIPIAYHFHVRKNKGLSLSSVLSHAIGIKQNGIFGRLADIMFIFICFGGLSITLGVSVPLVTEILGAVFGIKPTFALNVAIIVILSIVYSFSSYIGIQKGMSKISDWNVKAVIFFTIAVLIFGPTLFIISSFTQSWGLMLQNFIHMSLFSDPIGNTGFSASWTIFYWLYWITYAPFTGIFIAKVSKGRSIRAVVANTLLSGSFGCFLYFGVLGSLSIDRQITGVVDVVGALAKNAGNSVIIDIMNSLPFGSIFMIVFCLSTLLFLATTLDGAAFTMASTSMKGLKNDEEPSAYIRLFWCVMLSLVPLTMIFINADLNTIKTSAIITAVPIIFIMILIFYGFVKWLLKDYAKVPSYEIEKELMSDEKMH